MMTKTPDDIKNGLYWCSQHVDTMDCENCTYYSNKDCIDNLCSDVAKLVQQLEAELEDMTARYKIADDCAKKKGEMNEKLYAELTAVKAERDAAVADLKYVAVCETCKEFHRSALTEPCLHCTKYGLLDSENKYEWRGV